MHRSFFSSSKCAAWISTSQSKSNKIILTWCNVFIINLNRNKDEAWVCQTEWWSARVKHSRGEQILYGLNTVRNNIVCAPLKSCSVQNWVFSVYAVDMCMCFACFFGKTYVPYSVVIAGKLSTHRLNSTVQILKNNGEPRMFIMSKLRQQLARLGVINR